MIAVYSVVESSWLICIVSFLTFTGMMREEHCLT